ncbi:MAG: SGNH/GDSL hydrolase family protein [Flavobacteriales bacterium]|nr:SGNH/GDSL hydrolase family protein [Flavobacteriales bacterium]
MGRFIRDMLLLLFTFLVCYLTVMALLCSIAPQGVPLVYRIGDYLNFKGGNSYRKFQEFERDSVYDVVFIGSSHAFRGYYPEFFARGGYTSFNLGSSGQSPMNSYFILDAYLNKANTKLVLLDVFEGAMERDGLESTADLSQNIGSDRAAAGMALALQDPRAVNMLTLRWMRRDAPPMYADDDYRPGGSSWRSDSVRTRLHYRKGHPFKPHEQQVRYLRKCLQWCRDEGVPLVLVNHPYPHQSDHAKHAQFNAMLRTLTEEFNVPYIDMAYDHDLDDEDHFYDHNHLNSAGVERFNARLIPRLVEAGHLPQRP